MTTVEVLRDARELLATAGWGQGSFIGWGGCYCAAGACNQAASGFATVKNQASANAQAAVERVVGVTPGHLMTWNDNYRRTQADVVAAFDRAIAAEVRS